MGRKRVFVTGMGIFCPLGGEIKEFWNNLSHGKSGVHHITRFDPTPSLTQVAGIIQNYDAKGYFSPREQRSCEAFVQYGLLAARHEQLVVRHLRRDYAEPLKRLRQP